MQAKSHVLVVFIALAGFATAASAQDFSARALEQAFPYKDLPGVRPSKGVDEKIEAPNCTQEVRLQNAMRRNADGERGPAIVYRCEKDGLFIESARPPLSKYWNPLDAR